MMDGTSMKDRVERVAQRLVAACFGLAVLIGVVAGCSKAEDSPKAGAPSSAGAPPGASAPGTAAEGTAPSAAGSAPSRGPGNPDPKEVNPDWKGTAGDTKGPDPDPKGSTPESKVADKNPASAKRGEATPIVKTVGAVDPDVLNPPEKELLFADTRIKLRLVEQNYTKHKKEAINPYYISTEPLPNEILRRCVDMLGCKSPPPTEEQDSKPIHRLSVDDAKLISKMLKARLPTHAEWVNAHHGGVIKRMDCELTQYNNISLVEERGADGVFETHLSDEIRFTYSPQHEVPHACGMRIALDADIMSKADKP